MHGIAGCPTLAAFLFLRLGWDSMNGMARELANSLLSPSREPDRQPSASPSSSSFSASASTSVSVNSGSDASLAA